MRRDDRPVSASARPDLGGVATWAGRRLQAALFGAPSLSMGLTGDGRIALAADALLAATGLSAGDLLGRPWEELLVDDLERDGARQRLLDALDSGVDPATVEVRLCCGDGAPLVVEWTLTARRAASGRVTAIACLGIDVTRRVLAEQERDELSTIAGMAGDLVAIAGHHARHDRLTGLLNQAAFEDAVTTALREAADADRRVALLLVNIDRFSGLCDTLGYGEANSVLQLVGERLVNAMGAGAVVARWGGDEFAVLLPQIGSHVAAERAADLAVAVLRHPIGVAGHEVRITVSVGLAVFPAYGDTPGSLIANAGLAMRDARAHGGDAASKYRSALGLRAFERLRVEHQLHHALSRGQISMHYQPVVSLSSGRVVSVEALMRWDHPGLGSVPPSTFIPLAEETGMIRQLGLFALRSAAAQHHEWRRRGLGELRMSVNVSARQLLDPDLPGQVIEALEENTIPAGELELEITESAAMNDADAIIGVLRRLAGMGATIALDDFGTGYSSLHHLSRFPIHAIKIDRSFTGALQDESGGALALSLISLAQRLHVRVVAEGVETLAQLERLRAGGCDDAQGHLFSAAVAPDEAADLLGRRWPTVISARRARANGGSWPPLQAGIRPSVIG